MAPSLSPLPAAQDKGSAKVLPYPDLPAANRPIGDDGPEAGEDPFAALRQLLVGPEQARIEALREHIEDPGLRAQDIGRVLPEALRLSASRDGDLNAALTPMIERIIRDSVRRDRQTLSDALFPIIGPAIRKSIAEAFKQMLQSFNQMLAFGGLSWQGLRWRLEAWRSGRPVAEVVMLRTLVFKVEQVFLIHRRTGVLLQHLAADDDGSHQDADLVSAMLTAIQDFVHDSFGVSPPQGLDSIQVGDLTVWLESGPEAVLAVAIRGTAPEALRETLHEVIETLHLQEAEALRRFDGDPSAFASEKVRAELRRCLQSRRQDPDPDSRTSPFLWGLALLVVVALGYWGFWQIRERLAFDDYLQRLDAEPGILVTATSREDGGYLLRGLRDPLAANPADLVGKGILADRQIAYRFEPYQALNPRFVLLRARRALQPPASVSLSFAAGTLRLRGQAPYAWVEEARRLGPVLPGVSHLDTSALEAKVDLSPLQPPPSVRLDYQDGVLTASGRAPQRWILTAQQRALRIPGVDRYDDRRLQIQPDLSLLAAPEGVRLDLHDGHVEAHGSAPHAWILEARHLAPRIPGVISYDDSDLVDRERTELQRLRQGLEKVLIPFDIDTARLGTADKGIDDIAARIRRLLALARELGHSVTIVLVGHSDPTGRDRRNLELSRARAEWARYRLATAGVDTAILQIRAAGADEPVSTDASPEGMARNRSVTLEVHLSDLGEAGR